MHLIPAYGVLMAIVMLDETLYPFHVVGIGLIGVGIYLSTMLRPKSAAP
jgi:drug/metabolite transporter (DMT)-like permease